MKVKKTVAKKGTGRYNKNRSVRETAFMTKRFFVFMGMIALLFAPLAVRAAQTSTSSLEHLAKWEGDYPSMTRKPLRDLPAGEKFWDDPSVLAAMKKNLPVSLMRKIILGWDLKGAVVETPIAKKDGVLFVSVCKPHDCASNAARLYFDLSKGTAQMCWTETNPKTGRQLDVWISKKVRRLGIDSCARNDGFVGFKAFGDKE